MSATDRLSATKPKKTRPPLIWWRNTALMMVPLHLVLIAATIGLRPEHWIGDAILLGFALIPGWPRGLALGAAPFWLTGVIYENFRFVKHLRGPVHVADLYAAELKWFGLTVGNGAARERIIWPEYFRRNPSTFFDFISGIAYIGYLYQFTVVAIVLYFVDEKRLRLFGVAFVLTNVFGMIIYLAYPAAPPWYVELYGLGPAILTVASNAAGAARFDELLGISYFKNFYARSPVVFGAMPSLHVAYPMLVFCVTATMGPGWATWTLLFLLWVSFSAVYLRHHYIWDVVFGALVAVVAYVVVRQLFVLWNRWQARRAVTRGEGGDGALATESSDDRAAS